MKKVIASLAIVGALIGLTATAAGAHTHVVSATCEGLTVALAKYQGTNTLTVTLDGVTTSESFGASLALNKVTDKTVGHTWTVKVDSSDNVGEFTESGTIAGVCDGDHPASHDDSAAYAPYSASYAPACGGRSTSDDRMTREQEAIELMGRAVAEKVLVQAITTPPMHTWEMDSIRLDALLSPSPCPTCGGTGRVPAPNAFGEPVRDNSTTLVCPACTDGTVPPLLRWNEEP